MGMMGLLKMARGGAGAMDADGLAEILSAAGIDLKFSQITAGVESFRPLAESASLPSAKLMEIQGTMKGGDRLHAILAILPNSCDSHHRPKESAAVE